MCTIKQSENPALKHTLLQLTQTMQQIVKENNNELTNQIFEDFINAKTLKEKVWIAEALEENI
jgi:hypothetical protein